MILWRFITGLRHESLCSGRRNRRGGSGGYVRHTEPLEASGGVVHVRTLGASLSVFSAAQGVGLTAGLLLHMVAARYLAPADYGRFAVAHSIFLVLLVLLVNAIPNALRRRVSLDARQVGSAWRALVWLHLPLALGVSLLLAASGPLLAAGLGDAMLTGPLRLIAVDVALRAGVVEPAWLLLNGTGRHRLQAALMAGHSVLRCTLVAVAVIAGYGLSGAVAGLVAASVLSGMLVICLAQPFRGGESPSAGGLGPARDLFRWLQWAPAANVVNHLAMAGNLWLAKAMSTDAAAVGPYAACYLLASTLLPTGAILSSSCFARFASLVSAGASANAARVLRAALRAAGVLGVLAAAWTASSGESVLRLVFGSDYAGAADLLVLLWLAMTGTALYWFFCEMLAAAECLAARLAAVVITALATASLTIVWFQQAGFAGAAAALAVSSGLGVALTGTLLYRIVGPFLPWATLGRTVLAAAVAAAAARAWLHRGFPEGLYWLLGVQAGVYFVCLWLLGEFSAPRHKTALTEIGDVRVKSNGITAASGRQDS
jgi:O-antigen/teichoic acid export membrane protein